MNFFFKAGTTVLSFLKQVLMPFQFESSSAKIYKVFPVIFVKAGINAETCSIYCGYSRIGSGDLPLFSAIFSADI